MTEPEPTLIEEVTELLYAARTKTDLGRALNKAEAAELKTLNVRVNWNDPKSREAFENSVLVELDALRSAILLIARRISGLPDD